MTVSKDSLQLIEMSSKFSLSAVTYSKAQTKQISNSTTALKQVKDNTNKTVVHANYMREYKDDLSRKCRIFL